MAVLNSRYNPKRHLRDIFKSTKGIAFMGTPHRGSWIAAWLSLPLSILEIWKSTNLKLVCVLQRDNQLLESIRVQFSSMLRELQQDDKAIEVAYFFEELPLPIIKKVVVSKKSATFDGYDPISVHADHNGMVRFASTEETGFKRLLGELARWQSNINPPKPPVELVVSKLSQDCMDCLQSLDFPGMHDCFYDADTAMDGSFEPLLLHNQYQNWISSDQGLLWVKRKSGSGTSTLFRYALANQKNLVNGNDLVVSFFFHGRDGDLQKTPLGFFRSLVHQILRQVPAAFSDVVTEYLRKREQAGEPGPKWQWHEEELRKAFKSSLPEILKTCSLWLYIYALDECGEENAIGLLQYFKDLLRMLSSTRLQCHILIACQHYSILDGYRELDIVPGYGNALDISTYMNNRVSNKFLPSPSIPALVKNCASGVHA